MKLPQLRIGHLVAKLPLVQGGMSIRISTARLAAAVARTGGVGVIGASGLALDELRQEIRRARELARGGIIGINVMYAAREFLDIVATAIREKVDFITTGAGFSRDIFHLGKQGNVPILPIVSSGKLARIAKSLGAAAIVVESGEAGGHLGTLTRTTESLVPEVKAAVGETPVIAAGGIIDGKDMVKLYRLGADGVQIATRFVLAEECNAAPEFKARYQTATRDDVVIIRSPVGMPGRALRTPFVERLLRNNPDRVNFCDNCLKQCSQEYCIMEALIRAQQGDLERGLVFCGANVWKIKDRRILPTAEIVRQLMEEVSAEAKKEVPLTAPTANR